MLQFYTYLFKGIRREATACNPIDYVWKHQEDVEDIYRSHTIYKAREHSSIVVVMMMITCNFTYRYHRSCSYCTLVQSIYLLESISINIIAFSKRSLTRHAAHWFYALPTVLVRLFKRCQEICIEKIYSLAREHRQFSNCSTMKLYSAVYIFINNTPLSLPGKPFLRSACTNK